MDVGVAQQLVVNLRFRAIGDAVTANHEDFADVVLPSPLTDIVHLVGLEVDERVHFTLAQTLMSFGKIHLKIHSLVVQLLVLAPPYHRAFPLVRSGVFHQCHFLGDFQQQFSEVLVSLAFLPYAKEHPLKSERREVLPHLLTETSLYKPLGRISAFGVEQFLLDDSVFDDVVRELTAEVQPFAVCPCCSLNSKGKPPAILLNLRLMPLTMSLTLLKDQTLGLVVYTSS